LSLVVRELDFVDPRPNNFYDGSDLPPDKALVQPVDGKGDEV